MPKQAIKNQSQKELKETGEIPPGELTDFKTNEQFITLLNLEKTKLKLVSLNAHRKKKKRKAFIIYSLDVPSFFSFSFSFLLSSKENKHLIVTFQTLVNVWIVFCYFTGQ